LKERLGTVKSNHGVILQIQQKLKHLYEIYWLWLQALKIGATQCNLKQYQVETLQHSVTVSDDKLLTVNLTNNAKRFY